MTIEEALKVLYTLKMHPMHKGNLDHKNAVSLGIEALKVHQVLRAQGNFQAGYLLPGEGEK